jgi:acyl-CoA reductase-like NAD-dependent aldehyde dehydrogenase
MSHPQVVVRSPRSFFIGGQWSKPSSERELSVVSPVTEEVLLKFADATERDVDTAVAAARAAFDDGPWPRMSAGERAQMLRKVADILERRLPELSNAWTAQVGAPISLTK